jgi:prepilin-type N-terminal cleavage/methylation domain-containing protein
MRKRRSRIHSARVCSSFTLVEIMTVVVIIGVLAAVAIPAVARVKHNAQNKRFVSDLRTFAQAFETYATKNGKWPPDGTPAVVPTGMSGEFRNAAWTANTSIGGQWDWDYKQFGFTAGISVYQPTVDVAQMLEIDRLIDDGNLNTGNFRSRTSGYIYILQF